MSGNLKEAVRLCEHIIRQAFGDVVCRVASTLLNRGRLPIPTISRLAAVSRQSTLAAILILMQHNLVLSNGASIKELEEEELYEFDVQACLMRLRWGRILALTQERLGTAAVEIIQQLMVFGRLKAPEILTHCGGDYDGGRAATVTETTITLVRQHLIEPTRPELQILEADQRERHFNHLRRQKLLNKGQVMLSPADIDNINLEARHYVMEERKALRDVRTVLARTERQGRKKKGKGSEEFEYSLDPNTALRINYERYNLLIRDELLVKAAEDRWNKGAAEVMRAVLAASLNDESSLADIRTFNPPGYNEILEKISSASHGVLTAGIAGFSSSSSSSSSKAIPEIVRQYLRILAEADAAQPSGNQFLNMQDGGRSYMVELERIATKLRETLLFELVRERLGDKAARVLAVVARTGKISETNVRDFAMIQLKDARHYLSELQKLSLVETQEVPKTAAKSRAGLPSSAEWHLWQIDLARVYSLLVAGAYKTLGNILQRKEAEVEKRRQVLQREMAGGRDRLQAKDQEDLAELDDTRRKLAIAEMRSDMVVFVLRDMPGWPGKA